MQRRTFMVLGGAAVGWPLIAPAQQKPMKLPSIYQDRNAVLAGGLISYGIDQRALFRQAASYIDKLLKGEKPGELPVQQPTKFELVINLKTANTLGLTIPQALLARADEIIE